MISLDEDYLGFASDAILIRGLKVCGGLLCTLSNNRLVGAHFTSITTASEILTACTYVANHMCGGGNVTELYFVYNMAEWGARADKYSSAMTLIGDLKLMMRYGGAAKVFDKNILGASVDVKLTRNGAATTISHRLTPAPDPATRVPNSNVKRVKTQYGSNTPTILALDNVHTHQIPDARGGFVPFQGALFANV
jgi:hypothetical protein